MSSGVLYLTVVVSGNIARPTQSRSKSVRVYSSLVGDGRMGPFYADTTANDIPIEVIKRNDGKVTILPGRTPRRGEAGALAFFEYMLSYGALQAGDVVVTDNERCWKTEEVGAYLSSNGVNQLFYPKYAGAKLDPCDNSFHAHLRAEYNKRTFRYSLIGTADRIRILNSAYHSTSEKMVRGYMRHCGMFEGDPEHVMAELICEGRTLLPGDARVANECILAYLTFKDLTDYSEPDEAPAEERLKDAPCYVVKKRRRIASDAEKIAK